MSQVLENINLVQFANAIRVKPIGDDQPLPVGVYDLIARIFTACRVYIEQFAPFAPGSIKVEAIIRMGGYLYDAPAVTRTGVAFRESGAMSLVDPWVVRHAAAVEVQPALRPPDVAVGTLELLYTISPVNQAMTGNEAQEVRQQGAAMVATGDQRVWPEFRWGPATVADPTIYIELPVGWRLNQLMYFDDLSIFAESEESGRLRYSYTDPSPSGGVPHGSVVIAGRR